MKLEVGMHVRTIKGKIWIINSQQAISGHRKDIINASHNIIDLIELGDILDCEFGGSVSKAEVIEENNVLGIGWDNDGDFINLESLDIKSILTHEQIESMSYKVGD